MLPSRKPVPEDPGSSFARKVYQDQDKLLWKFAKTLEPDSETRKKSRRTIALIFKRLDQVPKISIDRRLVAGSVGKRTNILESDYDLVIFLNNEYPPFDKAVEAIKSVLMEMESYQYIRSTPYVLTFKLDGLNFDILPAVNLSAGKRGKSYILRAQLTQTLIKFENGNGIFSNSTLAEFAVSFVLNQSSIIRSVIRLAKYWTRKVEINVDVPGLFTIIEIVVIGCNRRKKKRSILTCFTRFILGMANFSSLNIMYFINYSITRVPTEILDQKPLILDPANPMNNLAKGVQLETIEIFQSAARRSLLQIADLSISDTSKRTILDLIDPRI